MINLHISNTTNIGDRVSSPLLYFPDLDATIADIDQNKHDQQQPVIYGGGAIANRAVRHARIQSGPTVFWGGGHTSRGKRVHPSIPDYSVFDLAGVRDHGTWSTHVPCPSCMSSLFDKEYQVEHDVVYYNHHQLGKLVGEPMMNNEHASFEEVIAFLGSGETIVTSSYHGVYWGMLLGKKVIVKSFGSKFHYFGRDPVEPSDTYLVECREKNVEFYHRVKELIR